MLGPAEDFEDQIATCLDVARAIIHDQIDPEQKRRWLADEIFQLIKMWSESYCSHEDIKCLITELWEMAESVDKEYEEKNGRRARTSN